MVRLTDAGRAAIEAAAPDHVEAVRAYVFDKLTREEQDQLAELMDRVLAGLPARDLCRVDDGTDGTGDY
jgi:DNA-binding MarR family transcriptional regulator